MQNSPEKSLGYDPAVKVCLNTTKTLYSRNNEIINYCDNDILSTPYILFRIDYIFYYGKYALFFQDGEIEYPESQVLRSPPATVIDPQNRESVIYAHVDRKRISKTIPSNSPACPLLSNYRESIA